MNTSLQKPETNCANKIASLSNMCHDLNNQLLPLVNYPRLLLDHPQVLQDSTKVKKYLETMNGSAENALRIVLHLRKLIEEMRVASEQSSTPLAATTVARSKGAVDVGGELPARGVEA